MTDLTFIDEGNSDYIKGMINFRKWRLVAKSIEQFQHFQQRKYELKIIDNITHFLTDLPTLSEDDMYELSLHHEPRGATLEEII